ncbi:hypothetical protein PsorP6_004846 [Peronosclerospora sorghi]|uniref:Uncharacterized protein n=1 Tax=Peronosclerospora sorghi TaxID=230839 RepID=A0ACC0W3H6_9STRA|nr:hypothetical protein PsorP6_004846 [Peronosclerospora sorghi]
MVFPERTDGTMNIVWAQLIRNMKTVAFAPIVKKLVPLCFVTGAVVEAFMVKSGFCASFYLFQRNTIYSGLLTVVICVIDDIVTISEAERRQLRDEERRQYLETKIRGE